MQQPNNKVLFSASAERNLIIAFLTLEDAVLEAQSDVSAEEFYYIPYKNIAKVCFDLFNAGKGLDIVSIENELTKREQIEELVGENDIWQLKSEFSHGTVENNAQIVRTYYKRRSIVSTLQKGLNAVYNEGIEVDELLGTIQTELMDIDSTQNNEVKSLGETRMPTLEQAKEIKEARLNGTKSSLVPSGLTAVDKILAGFRKTEFILLAARPGMGKSAYVVSLMANIAKMGYRSVLFSLEMSEEEVTARFLAHESEATTYKKVQTGYLSIDEEKELLTVGTGIENDILMDCSSNLSIEKLRSKAIKLKIKKDINFIVVDYLQLMTCDSMKANANREQEISKISRSLKNLAKELDVPVLALSQLSRAVESRGGDKKPMLSDLRESGCLTGDTLITNAETGERTSIKELAERKEQTPIPIFATNNSFKVSVHQMSKVFYSGKKQVYELKTQTGRIIKASANHPFLKIEGWTRLENLKVGDKIGVVQKNKDKSISSIIYWDNIVSITPLGIEDVYDATVPAVSNFTANGIIVHNSLEQDANAVIFLYRPEYYGIETYSDGSSALGVTEAIIAKNRAGGLGTARINSERIPQSKFTDFPEGYFADNEPTF